MVSLTLSPALAALLLQPHEAQAPHARRGLSGRLQDWADRFNQGFDRLAGAYSKTIQRVLQTTGVMIIIYVGLLAFTGWRLAATPRGFIPAQDQGNLLIAVNLPPGASLGRTDEVMRDAAKRLLAAPTVAAASIYAGVDATSGTTASNSGQIYLILKPFAERKRLGMTPKKIIADLQHRLEPITGADIKIIQPPPVRGIGTTGGFKTDPRGPGRPWVKGPGGGGQGPGVGSDS